MSLEQQTEPRPHDSYCCPSTSSPFTQSSHNQEKWVNFHYLMDHWHLLDTFSVTFLLCRPLELIKIACQLRLVATERKTKLLNLGHYLPIFSWPQCAILTILTCLRSDHTFAYWIWFATQQIWFGLYKKYDISCSANMICRLQHTSFVLHNNVIYSCKTNMICPVQLIWFFPAQQIWFVLCNACDLCFKKYDLSCTTSMIYPVQYIWFFLWFVLYHCTYDT